MAVGEGQFVFTVLRVTSDTLDLRVLDDIARELDAYVPGAYRGLRARKDGFSVDVSESDTWSEHRAAMMSLVRAATAAILRARALDASVCVDVAVEPEDVDGAVLSCFHVDVDLMRELSKLGVSLEFSLYGRSFGSEP